MKMISRVLLFSAFIFCWNANALAQDVYLSISGTEAPFDSGDELHQYEFWVKPGSDAAPGNIQIYDAGLGGAVDLFRDNELVTETTFSIFHFDEVYAFNEGKLEPKSTAPAPIKSLTTSTEERYKNRWVSFSEIDHQSSENGFLIRVSASEGDDINNFRFRLTDQNSQIFNSDRWQLIAIDLSIGVYRTAPEHSFQIRPYLPQKTRNTVLKIRGEEDTKVTKMDAFGEQYEAAESNISAQKYSLPNNWGLHFTGSTEFINNFTVTGAKEPVLWVFDPIQTSNPQKPSVDIIESPGTECSEKSFFLRSTALPPQALKQASWKLKGETVAKGQQPNITLAEETGRMTLDVLVPNPSSYFPEYWVYQEDVFLNTPPVAVLSAPKQIISPAETLELTATDSYDPEGQPLSYTWFVNGVERGTGATFSFSNTISGLYDISVQVSNGGTIQACSNARKHVQVRVNTQPYAEISNPDVFGTDEAVPFRVSNQNDADNDRLSFTWKGTGISEMNIGDSISVFHKIPGKYDITLSVDDGSKASNAVYNTTNSYEVNAAPSVFFTAPEKAAPGDILVLDATATADPNDTDLQYRWFVDGDEFEGNETAELKLQQPGTYTISLRVDDLRGVSNSVQEASQSIRINDAPIPEITAPEITSSSLVQIQAKSATKIAYYSWDLGDGTTLSGSEISHRYQKPGTYTITLSVDDGEGLKNSIQTAQHKLIINQFPTAKFSAPKVVAPGETFTPNGSLSFDEDGEIESYTWFINGAKVGTGIQPELTLPKSGAHVLSLSVTDNSGFEEAVSLASQVIRANKAPTAKWTSTPAEPVPSEEIEFSAASSYDEDGEIVSYTWTFAEGTVKEGKKITHSFPESGSHDFTLSVTDNDELSNSTTIIEDEIAVNHQPYIVTEPVIRSNNLAVNFDASQSYDLDNDPIQFEWTLPDGSKRNESSFTWKASESGVHIISLLVDDGKELANSVNTEMVRVLVNQPVKAVVDSVIASCTGQTVLFNSSRSYDPDGDAFQTSWDFGNGDSSDQANPSYSYQKPGVYQAKLTMNDGFSGQSTVAKIPVIIEGSPIARMNIADTTICVNSALKLDGTSSSDPSGALPSLSWDFGDGNSEAGPKVNHVYTKPGNYILSLTVEGSGSGLCSNIAQTTANIRVIEGPEANFDLPEWTAPGEEIQLDGSASIADGGFKNVQWLIESADTTFVEEGLKAGHTFETPGEYFVTLNLETNTSTSCNTVSLSKIIKVNDAPEIHWELSEFIAAGHDLKLDATGSTDADGFITKYTWFYNDSLISHNASEIIKAAKAGENTIRLEVSDNSDASNQTVTLEKTIFVNSSPQPEIQVPEARYLNEQISMNSQHNQDADGDALSSEWLLNGTVVNEPTFVPRELKTYRVVLIQDDGRGLSNSVDSAIVEYVPKRLPVAKPKLPQKVVSGAELSIQDLEMDAGWMFVTGDKNYQETWTAGSAKNDSLILAWLNEGAELTRAVFPIEVLPPLAFSESAEDITIAWNPANPTFIAKAPQVNRNLNEVSYQWFRDGEKLGEGIQLSVTLQQGINRFTVKVIDKEAEQSDSTSTEIVISAE